MITAPTGTSSRTEAARARRSAACIPVRSLGDGVPLRTGPLGDRRRACASRRWSSVALHPDGVALVEVPFEQLQRDRVLQLALDHPLERTGAVDRVVALRRASSSRASGVTSSSRCRAASSSSSCAQLEVHDLRPGPRGSAAGRR